MFSSPFVSPRSPLSSLDDLSLAQAPSLHLLTDRQVYQLRGRTQVVWTRISSRVYVVRGRLDVSSSSFPLFLLLVAFDLEKADHLSFSQLRYLRHYLNILILWSVWTEFDLIP